MLLKQSGGEHVPYAASIVLYYLLSSKFYLKVGVRGKDVAILGVEKKSVLQLQDPRTVRKVVMLDDHICLAFAGMLWLVLFAVKKLTSCQLSCRTDR